MNLYVPQGAFFLRRRRNLETKGWKKILNNHSGKVVGGQVLAIMGASGSGKTSLLSVLAQYVDSGSLLGSIISGPRVTGHVLVNNLKMTRHRAKFLSALVPQDDIVFPYLTVEETLFFSAQLRTPGNMESRKLVVDRLIKELRLERCRHTQVGNERIRGVSGGERKRTSIGFDLVSDPRMNFLIHSLIYLF